MTEEQIRQESEHYAYGTDFSNDKPEVIAYKSFLSGAHSRNEEVNQWKESKRKLRLRLMQRIHELRNPWRDAKKELPKEGERVFVSYAGLKSSAYYYGDGQWSVEGYGLCDFVDYWMPIPELPKGE